MIKKTPMVSVILPTYNWREEWIRKSIESVLSQTFKDFEFIIINDCSTNDIEKTIKEYEKKDSRIVYVKNEKNLKQTRTMSKGISLSNWKYISRIDDDDIRADNTQLQQQFDFMEKNPDYWIVWTNAEIMDENENFLYILNRPWTDKEIRDNMLVWCRFLQSSIMMRKSVLDKVWWYDSNWNLVEDYELFLRIWIVSKMRIINDIHSKYRVNLKSVTRMNYKKQKWMTLKLFFKYFKYYPKKYLLKALCYRFWELIVPLWITRKVLMKLRSVKI